MQIGEEDDPGNIIRNIVHGGDEQPMDDQPMQTQEPAPVPEPTFPAPSIVHGGDEQPMDDQPMQTEEPAIDFRTDPPPALAPALVAQPPTTTQIALPAPMETNSSGNQSTVADPGSVGTAPPFNLQPPTAMSLTTQIRNFLTPVASQPQPPPPPPSTPEQRLTLRTMIISHQCSLVQFL
jgi:hypothetical protein